MTLVPRTQVIWLTKIIDQVSEEGTISSSRPATAPLLGQVVLSTASAPNTHEAIELSGDSISESPVDSVDLSLRPPQRTDTEAGGRSPSTAFAAQQLRHEPERRPTFPLHPAE